MTDLTNLIAPFKARAEGVTDLCREHLRQSIRHVQRNCDIDCNVHAVESTWDDCKQPDRYDGARIADALASIPRLLAALEGVLALADAYEAKANGYDDSAERFVPGEVRSRYKSMAEDEREISYRIRAAVVAALGEGK